MYDVLRMDTPSEYVALLCTSYQETQGRRWLVGSMRMRRPPADTECLPVWALMADG